MSDGPKYTPYRGGFPGFQIALKPLDPDEWIEVDDGLPDRLAKKDRHFEAHFDQVFMAEDRSGAAQAEVLALLTGHLTRRFPGTYRQSGNVMEVVPAGRRVALNDGPPLLAASRLVDEDLCLLQRDGADWRLTAASLCFPSHWSLASKFGKSMADIHTPVPGFAGQMADRVTRIFDHLAPERPVWRLNWSLHDEATLALPEPPAHPRFEGDEADAIREKSFLRIERQTLRKLPGTGAILFTIRTYLDPLARLRAADPQLVRDVADAIEKMDTEQLAYKGLTLMRDEVMASLRDI